MTMRFFVNRDTHLIVVDVVDADEQGGVEILRQTMEPLSPPSVPCSKCRGGKGKKISTALDGSPRLHCPSCGRLWTAVKTYNPCHVPMNYGVCKRRKGHDGKHSRREA